MSVRRPATGILARWLGWALFWYGVYYAGIEVQTWVFSKDAGPKPVAADILEPLQFWVPAVFFFMPVWPAQRLFDFLPAEGTISALHATIAAWSITVAGLVVWVEDRLRPARTPRIGTWVLIGVTVALLAEWLIAFLPLGTSAEFGGSGSELLLSGLVLATWVLLVAGLVTIGVRRLRRLSEPAVKAELRTKFTPPPTSLPPA